ncbi:hypothetical protein HDU97_006146 [Phlyctochytrium planicorne]|nr:hypothetical protein HDU97_006146 [Phlyctochytrium planicorne]
MSYVEVPDVMVLPTNLFPYASGCQHTNLGVGCAVNGELPSKDLCSGFDDCSAVVCNPFPSERESRTCFLVANTSIFDPNTGIQRQYAFIKVGWVATIKGTVTTIQVSPQSQRTGPPLATSTSISPTSAPSTDPAALANTTPNPPNNNQSPSQPLTSANNPIPTVIDNQTVFVVQTHGPSLIPTRTDAPGPNPTPVGQPSSSSSSANNFIIGVVIAASVISIIITIVTIITIIRIRKQARIDDELTAASNARSRRVVDEEYVVRKPPMQQMSSSNGAGSASQVFTPSSEKAALHTYITAQASAEQQFSNNSAVQAREKTFTSHTTVSASTAQAYTSSEKSKFNLNQEAPTAVYLPAYAATKKDTKGKGKE